MSDGYDDRAVVDASVALKWVLQEPYTAEARGLLLDWTRRRIRVLAPGWLACEAANVLYQRVRRGDLDLARAALALRGLLAEVVLLDPEPATAARALAIADVLGRSTTYDAQYAALAERERCELWTADERFWNAAHARFPWIRWVGEPTRR